MDHDTTDVVLIGAGIMSATLGTMLKELEPSLTVRLVETLDDCAQESSEAWNNAGTGHAANFEMKRREPFNSKMSDLNSVTGHGPHVRATTAACNSRRQLAGGELVSAYISSRISRESLASRSADSRNINAEMYISWNLVLSHHYQSNEG